MSKQARPDHPIHKLIAARWSPYGFQDRAVDRADVRSLFEAARWAASSFNEQPWRYIVATRDEPEAFGRLLSCLVDGNQAWARRAPILALGVAMLEFGRNGKPNRVALHDLGLASAGLTLEATARGLSVHQMAGILPDRAAELYGIPENARAVTALAVGYTADPDTIDEALGQRDRAPRSRTGIQEFVFGERWGSAASIVRD